MTMRRRLRVKRHRQMRRLLALDNVEQRIGKTVKRGSIHTFGSQDRPRGKSKMRPVNQRHAVQQK